MSQQIWSTATDTANRSAMSFQEGSLVYKLLFSAARPGDRRTSPKVP
jgi:hypothetical protein